MHAIEPVNSLEIVQIHLNYSCDKPCVMHARATFVFPCRLSVLLLGLERHGNVAPIAAPLLV